MKCPTRQYEVLYNTINVDKTKERRVDLCFGSFDMPVTTKFLTKLKLIELLTELPNVIMLIILFIELPKI